MSFNLGLNLINMGIGASVKINHSRSKATRPAKAAPAETAAMGSPSDGAAGNALQNEAAGATATGKVPETAASKRLAADQVCTPFGRKPCQTGTSWTRSKLIPAFTIPLPGGGWYRGSSAGRTDRQSEIRRSSDRKTGARSCVRVLV